MRWLNAAVTPLLVVAVFVTSLAAGDEGPVASDAANCFDAITTLGGPSKPVSVLVSLGSLYEGGLLLEEEAN